MDLSSVAYCKIHPAIGIARVGNSPEGLYIGPEVPDVAAPAPESGASPYKDDQGRLLRMACRFRVFGYDAADEVVGEITNSETDANIEVDWRVHVANSKAAWYDFQMAMDIPEASAVQVPLRNASVPKSDRKSLVNDPGPKGISGQNAGPVDINGGSVFGVDVALGELRTDEVGRLIFLGGHGHSGSMHGEQATTFANNNGWFDDTSDGSIDAEVCIDGKSVPVTGAWVVTAPPDYGPGVFAVTTMWDIVFDVATQIDPCLRPAVPSFERDIYPIFSRFAQNQWVNAGFAEEFGWGAPRDFTSPTMRSLLANNSPENRQFRGTVFASFRNPSYAAMQPGALPPMYGDAVNFPPSDPRQWLTVSDLQYSLLSQWADGDFTTDEPPWPESLETVAVGDQPRALDRAALDACLGGPFHPGCELTWPMRHKRLYGEALRIRRRVGSPFDPPERLDQTTAVGVGGPLDGSNPGDLSHWMAVPWQTDTSSCLYAYVGHDFGLFLPTFWPARVPNNVITEEQYSVIMSSAPKLDRIDAFAPRNRAYWLRNVGGRSPAVEQQRTINRFVEVWGQTGVVAPLPGPGDGAFPEVMHVETGNTLDPPSPTAPSTSGPEGGQQSSETFLNPRHFR